MGLTVHNGTGIMQLGKVSPGQSITVYQIEQIDTQPNLAAVTLKLP